MGARIPQVTRAAVVKDHQLRLTFDDGLTGDVDLSDLPARRQVFTSLAEPENFAQVRVNPKTHTVEWPGGIDLDPEDLYAEAQKNARPANHTRPFL